MISCIVAHTHRGGGLACYATVVGFVVFLFFLVPVYEFDIVLIQFLLPSDMMFCLGLGQCNWFTTLCEFPFRKLYYGFLLFPDSI